MSERYQTETFFRPPELARSRWQLAGPVFNRCQLLLKRSPRGAVFVPIRSMQYLAVIDAQEIIFVDSQGTYSHQGGAGGRLVLLAWQPREIGARPAVDAPLPCDLVYYLTGLDPVQRRLVGEFGKALTQLEQRYRDREISGQGAQVIKIPITDERHS
jgi:hypothetical protein